MNSCRNSKCKFYFNIFFNYGDNKETVKSNKEKKKKHNKVFMLGKSKLNSIEILIPQALINLEKIYKESKTIVNEKGKMSE